MEELSLLEPTGTENPQPVFLTRNLTAKAVKLIGNTKTHLKFLASDGVYNFDVIGFDLGKYKNLLKSTFDLIYHLSINEFMGTSKIQMQMLDLKPH